MGSTEVAVYRENVLGLTRDTLNHNILHLPTPCTEFTYKCLSTPHIFPIPYPISAIHTSLFQITYFTQLHTSKV